MQQAVAKLQNENDAAKEKKLSLQKVNNTLETSIQKYALRFKEEKDEKKERIEKYDRLQNEHRRVSRNYNFLF